MNEEWGEEGSDVGEMLSGEERKDGGCGCCEECEGK